MTPSLPARIGRFEVVDLIGTGAFATVYRARDDRLDADVAIKVLAENHSFDPDLRERFIMEGHLLRRVDSSHVVTVFDLGETDAGQPFLVLDLAAGGDLRARRREHGDALVVPDDIVAVADQVAAALGALHAERVVHRDVTPGNLLIRSRAGAERAPGRLLGDDEQLMLADLGLSKDLALASGLTVGTGTAGFTPPEQRDAAWVDPRADIWAASALVVWLVTGRQPDDRSWPAEMRRRGCTDDLVEELARGLSPDVPTRHPDAAAWRTAVVSAIAPPRTIGPRPVRAAAVPARSPRRRSAVLAAALVALVLAGALGLLAGRLTASDDGPEVTAEDAGDGRVRTRASAGDLVVVAVGPEQVALGETATFTAEVEGAAHYVWIAPDGQVFVDTPTVRLSPTGTGETDISLTGTADDGTAVTADVTLVVTGS